MHTELTVLFYIRLGPVASGPAFMSDAVCFVPDSPFADFPVPQSRSAFIQHTSISCFTENIGRDRDTENDEQGKEIGNNLEACISHTFEENDEANVMGDEEKY